MDWRTIYPMSWCQRVPVGGIRWAVETSRLPRVLDRVDPK